MGHTSHRSGTYAQRMQFNAVAKSLLKICFVCSFVLVAGCGTSGGLGQIAKLFGGDDPQEIDGALTAAPASDAQAQYGEELQDLLSLGQPNDSMLISNSLYGDIEITIYEEFQSASDYRCLTLHFNYLSTSEGDHQRRVACLKNDRWQISNIILRYR